MARVSAMEKTYDFLVGQGFSPAPAVFDDMIFGIMERTFNLEKWKDFGVPEVVSALSFGDVEPARFCLDLLEEARRRGITRPVEEILAEACKVCEEGKAVPFA